MAFTNLPPLPAAFKTHGVTIVNADGTTKKTVYTAGANGGKVVSVGTTSDDTAVETLQLWVNDGTTDLLIGTKTIPIQAGFITGTPAFNWFDGIQMPQIPIDRDGQRFIWLPPNGILKVAATVAITAAKTMYTVAICFDF